MIRLTQGELVVEDSLSIDGTSVGGVLITGDADDDDITVGDTNITDVSASFGGTAGDDDDLLDDNSRVVNFTGSSGNLTLTGLTITGGRATGSIDVGGGILFDSGGVLSLSNSTVSGNSSGGDGGGISTTNGDVSLSSSTVSGNSSGGNGGGISNFQGDVSLSSSTVSGNSSGGNGGGIRTRNGDVSLSSSTVSDNNSVGGYYGGGGGVFAREANVSLLNSTVSGNSTASRGGGIYIYELGDLSLVNSTVSGNSSVDNGGGIHVYGDVSLLNSTVSGNSSGAIGGGGVAFPENNLVTINNSIIAGNTASETAPDVLAVGDMANNLIVRNSLIGNATGSGITSMTGTGNILNQAALLGPLSDNGGPTQTHRLLPGSPAIDAGDNSLAVDANGTLLQSDQRGELRLFDGNGDGTATVDIGAVESQIVGSFLLGDVNQNGVVDFADIAPFINLLSGNTFLDEADIDRSGVVDFSDISPFINLLASSGTMAVTAPTIVGTANPVNSAVSVVSISAPVSEPVSELVVEPESFAATSAPTVEVPITTETTQARNGAPASATVNQNNAAAQPFTQMTPVSVQRLIGCTSDPVPHAIRVGRDRSWDNTGRYLLRISLRGFREGFREQQTSGNAACSDSECGAIRLAARVFR